MSKNKTPIWKDWKFWTTIIELLLIIGLGLAC